MYDKDAFVCSWNHLQLKNFARSVFSSCFHELWDMKKKNGGLFDWCIL